jgi:hypothetical protein
MKYFKMKCTRICKSKPQWDITSQPLGWFIKKLKENSVSKAMENGNLLTLLGGI